ncbi:Ni2+-binding GTPase involved in maturation of urease and hydrogenase [Methanococcus voltae]|uniref:GTP-binding protein n=1 Tax=Methanococcus voltae TaxID=2188 RepID=UPI001AEA0BB6|nr:GTP-binding protein [Methanococcus voltae]MBP2143291.1 Ni2+-binding GTPase involved in maturation of urease and hydrogenase [Methanococcus voltae]
MKVVIVAGTPGAGKTSVMTHTIKQLQKKGKKTSVIKIDCLYTDDDVRYGKLGVPTLIGLSKDMCPDHFAIYNIEEMVEWAKEQNTDTLIIETAGLCHRCAPYTKNSLGVCVIDATSGPNTPRKVGPFLTSADVVAITKGDIISQAEREVFRERVLEMNPNCTIYDVNGLSGQGCAEIAEEITEAKDITDLENELLRHNAPLSVCTLCVGETRIAKKYHRGVLRRIDGFTKYVGE